MMMMAPSLSAVGLDDGGFVLYYLLLAAVVPSLSRGLVGLVLLLHWVCLLRFASLRFGSVGLLFSCIIASSCSRRTHAWMDGGRERKKKKEDNDARRRRSRAHC